MKKLFFLSCIMIIPFFLISQNKAINPHAEKEIGKIFSNNHASNTVIKSSDWWVPDTIMVEKPLSKEKWLFQYNEQRLNTSKLITVYNNVADCYENKERYTYLFDGDGRMINDLFQEWRDSTWVNVILINCVFDASDNSTIYLIRNWSYSQWVNEKMILTHYDDNNNPISELHKQWENGEWIDVLSSTYLYDQNNNLIEYRQSSSITWLEYTLCKYTYDINNNITDITYTRDGFNIKRFSYTYENNRLIEMKEYIDNWTGWIQKYRTTYYYDSNGLLLGYTRYGEENNRCSYTYNEEGFCISEHYKKQINSYWTSTRLFNRAYDQHGNCISVRQEIWEGEEWALNDDESIMFDYNTYSSFMEIGKCQKVEIIYTQGELPLAISEFESSQVSLYPNPTQDFIVIETENAEIISVELYNLLGQRLGTYNHPRIQTAHLPAGVYLLKIHTSQGTVTKKMAKQ